MFEEITPETYEKMNEEFEEGKILPSELLSQLKKKSTIGDKEC